MDTKAFLKIVGDRIRAVRKSKKISQEKLAELSSLHPTYISDIERGKVNASISSFLMVAKALNIPFSDLVNLPSGKMDKNIEVELAEFFSRFRGLDKKKQTIFLSAANGLISGIEKS
jgi:XRE family transcriptional regulator, regulator of sulfur utilization